MKRILLTGFVLICISAFAGIAQVRTHQQLYAAKISEIEPEGWIRDMLLLQRDGLTGNIHIAGYPYNTCMWAGTKIEGGSKKLGSQDWWPYEQTGYYIDGLTKLAHLLNDKFMIEKSRVYTNYVLENPMENNRLGPGHLEEKWCRWPYAGFFRALMSEYEVTGNEEIIEKMEKHYLTYTAKDLCDELDVNNVEQLCWLYEKTGNEKLIEIAEEAYRLFKSDIKFRNRSGSDLVFASERKPDQHGVVYMEILKVPVLLHRVTGKEEYLEEAINGADKMIKHFMLSSGLPSTHEHFYSHSDTSGHETCNMAVLPYTFAYLLEETGNPKYADWIEKAVFNAAMGSITKDFKAHQYFSAPNQVIATHTSCQFYYGESRMAYKPGHDVECCTGNLTRCFPYFTMNMWKKGKNNEVVATLYGPGTFYSNAGTENKTVEISAITNYPFSDEIQYTILCDGEIHLPLSFRIPAWSKSTSLSVNGKKVQFEAIPGTFTNYQQVFQSGDVITLKFSRELTYNQIWEKAVSVEYGPLVFSLPVDAAVTTLVDEKSSETFPSYNFEPASEWNYGLDKEAINNVKITMHEMCENPWLNPPIKISIPAHKMQGWQISSFTWMDGKNTAQLVKIPDASEFDKMKSDKTEKITLVPYGCTLLRITDFPYLK